MLTNKKVEILINETLMTTYRLIVSLLDSKMIEVPVEINNYQKYVQELTRFKKEWDKK